MPRPMINEPGVVTWLRPQYVKFGAAESEIRFEVRKERNLSILEAGRNFSDNNVATLEKRVSSTAIRERAVLSGAPPSAFSDSGHRDEDNRGVERCAVCVCDRIDECEV